MLDAVSKPSQDDHEAGELGEAMKEYRIEFVAGNQSTKGLQPTDGAFDDPASSIAPQWTSVLCFRPDSTFSMGTDQLDAAIGQTFSQDIAVGGPIIDQPLGDVLGDRLFEQRLDQRDFARAGGIHVDGQRKSSSIDQEHELGAFAPLGGTDEIAPLFAEANVPSAKLCSQSTAPRSSSWFNKRSQARSQRPLIDHSTKRRKQVT